MNSNFCNSFLESLPHRRLPLLLYAATWTAILTVTVAFASFTPEIAFVSTLSPTSSFSQPCRNAGFARLPLDIPAEIFCFPARLFNRSRTDMIVPPVFAAVIVAGSAFLVKAIGLFEADDEHL